MSYISHKTSHSWFKQLFELSPDPTWIIDGNQFVECNGAAARTLGYSSREELLNVHPSRLSPASQPDGEDSYTKAERMMAIAREQDLHRFEWIHTKADGSQFLAEVTLSTLKIENEQLLYCVWRDITERRRAEELAKETELKYRQLFEQANDGIFLQDATGFIDCNEQGARMYGLSREEVIHRSPAELCPERQADGRLSAVVAAEKTAAAMRGENPRFEWQAKRSDGATLDVEICLNQVTMHGEIHLQAIVRDITARRRAEEVLQESELRFRRAVEEAPFPIMIHARDGSVFSINRSWTEITGYTLEDIPTTADWLEKAHGGNSETVGTQLDSVFNLSIRKSTGEYTVRCRDGGTRVWEISTAGIGSLPDGRSIAISSASDITERKMMEDHVRQLAFHDNLTKLPNRRLLNDRLSQLLAAGQRSGCYAAMLFLDLDNFKRLNDAHGHEVGDLLLIEVANRLKASVREMDTVARFGGDEFVVILSELDADKTESAAQAAIVAEKIRLLLSRRYPLTVKQAGKKVMIVEHECTASIGVVLFASHETKLEALINWADKAMYQAKESGRNAVRFHHSVT